MKSGDHFAIGKQVDAIALDWLERRAALHSASAGWVAEYNDSFRSHATEKIGGTFEWQGHQWRLLAIEASPCECDVQLAYVKKRSGSLRRWSSVSCPRGKCKGTWEFSLDA